CGGRRHGVEPHGEDAGRRNNVEGGVGQRREWGWSCVDRGSSVGGSGGCARGGCTVGDSAQVWRSGRGRVERILGGGTT
ncbi:hypothetical protein KI387_013743, partial [Taxus chinensis]